jgi:hypothetical protein
LPLATPGFPPKPPNLPATGREHASSAADPVVVVKRSPRAGNPRYLGGNDYDRLFLDPAAAPIRGSEASGSMFHRVTNSVATE